MSVKEIYQLYGPEGFNYIGMLQATGDTSEIPGILPAISAGYRGTVLVVKGVWLVMNTLHSNKV